MNELVEANDKIKKNENEKAKDKIKDKNDKEKIEEKKDRKETKDINKEKNKDLNNNVNTNIKIPKMNPLSGMSKNFNKFDIVPGNAMPGMMMPFSTTTWIPEANNEN